MRRTAADGWAFVILDGKLFDCDRVTESVSSVKGNNIDAWYSGKHRDFGANIQAIMLPNGLPVWTADAMPGHLHDLSCARSLDITAALNWAAAKLDLPTLADSGYEGAVHGIKTPAKQPPTASPSLSPTAVSTGCCAVCAGKANAVSRSWSAAGKPCVTARSAPEESATSSRQPYTSPISNTATSANLAEITSLLKRWGPPGLAAAERSAEPMTGSSQLVTGATGVPEIVAEELTVVIARREPQFSRDRTMPVDAVPVVGSPRVDRSGRSMENVLAALRSSADRLAMDQAQWIVRRWPPRPVISSC